MLCYITVMTLLSNRCNITISHSFSAYSSSLTCMRQSDFHYEVQCIHNGFRSKNIPMTGVQNVPKIQQPPQNSKCQICDIKQVLYREPKKILGVTDCLTLVLLFFLVKRQLCPLLFCIFLSYTKCICHEQFRIFCRN